MSYSTYAVADLLDAFASSELAAASARLRPLRDTLAELVDRDSAAYQAVIAAYRLPKNAARADAIVAAMRGATETPLAMMRACAEALDIAGVVAEKGVVSAASDVRVAIELILTAVRGAGLSVDANLVSMKEEAAFVAGARAERQKLEEAAVVSADRARRLLPSAV